MGCRGAAEVFGLIQAYCHLYDRAGQKIQLDQATIIPVKRPKEEMKALDLQPCAEEVEATYSVSRYDISP